MTTHAIECVTFRLAAGVEDKAFLEAAEAVHALLGAHDGFVRRNLSKGEDGTWLDYVEWRSLAIAQAAASELPSRPEFGPFMQAIDPKSVTMTYYALTLAT